MIADEFVLPDNLEAAQAMIVRLRNEMAADDKMLRLSLAVHEETLKALSELREALGIKKGR